MPNSLYKKLFLSPYYFTIGIKKRSEALPPASTAFKCEYTMPADPQKWYADPLLVDDGDNTFMFYEAVSNGKGHIEAASINNDCSVGEPSVLLKDDCHYSYPFVFKYRDEWYMIPESSSACEVRLYKAAHFPYEWDLSDIILREKAVDTTVFEASDGLIMLTYYIDLSGTEFVTPHAFRLTIDGGKCSCEELKWPSYDGYKVRGAGGVFTADGKRFRPAQLNSEFSYGNGIVFNEITVDSGVFSEAPVSQMLSDSVACDGGYFDGLHTYSRSKRFEAIDIRCREFDALKVAKKLLNRKR